MQHMALREFTGLPNRDSENGPLLICAEPHSSVGSNADLRTGGRWSDQRLGQYSFRGLMIVIATGSSPLSALSIVSPTVMWESSQWLGKNILRSMDWIGALAVAT